MYLFLFFKSIKNVNTLFYCINKLYILLHVIFIKRIQDSIRKKLNNANFNLIKIYFHLNFKKSLFFVNIE